MYAMPVSRVSSRPANDDVDVTDLLATVYVFRIDADGAPSFPFVSRACAELYGLEAADAMADVSLMHEAVHLDDRDRFAEDGQHSLRTLQPVHSEVRIVRPDASERRVVISSRPRRMPDGSTEWIGIVSESPLRHVSVATREHTDHSESSVQDDVLKRKVRAQIDAMAMLGHDVAGPFTAIMATAEFALDELDDGSVVPASLDLLRRRLHAIIRQARRLSDLRDDFVTVAAADASVIQARSRTVDVLAHLRAAADVEAAGAKLVVECPDDLFCAVQPSHLQQMLGNLVSNALRYAEREVTLSAAASGSRVLITVKDDGPGVPPEVAARLFQRFAHAGLSVRPPRAGTGLGLYIVRALAHANGGTVLFTPTDAGTRFTLALPRAAEPTG